MFCSIILVFVLNSVQNVIDQDHAFPSLAGYMLTVFQISFINLGYTYSINSSKMIGYFPVILMDINRLFLKFNRFIY